MPSNQPTKREVVLSLSIAIAIPEGEENNRSLDESSEYITEIWALELQNGRHYGNKLHLYLKPDVDIETLEFPQYGINRDLIRDKPSFAQVADQLIDFIGRSNIVVYSLDFERGVLNAELRRLGLSEYGIERFIYVGALAQDVLGDELESRGIDSVAELLSINVESDLDESSQEFGHVLMRIYQTLFRRADDLSVPQVPDQGAGPHFEINEAGVVDFVNKSQIDADGNNVKTLESLHPILQELSKNIRVSLSSGNVPYARLLSIINKYDDLISQDLDLINFDVLFGMGIRVENAISSAQSEINRFELPRFNEDTSEELASLVRIHGAFILSTASGRQLIEAEDRFARTPEDEYKLQELIKELIEKLRNRPELINQNSLALIDSFSEHSIQLEGDSRSIVFSTSTVTNLSIVLTAAAVVAAIPITSLAAFGVIGGLSGSALALIGYEGIKKSRPFADATKPIVDKLDAIDPTHIETFIRTKSLALRPFVSFFSNNKLLFEKISQTKSSLSWLKDAVSWINDTRR